MSHPTLRFVHASDFHLERPLGGVSEVPAHLREIFLEAPFRAARQVFETVLSEGADALLLTGDLVEVHLGGPRAVLFLQEQFQRLADREVPIYWATGDCDPAEAWPACAPLPENVHLFPCSRVESHELRRKDEPIARIQGISRRQGTERDDSGFYHDAHGLFTVGVAYGTGASPGEEADRVDYMALGGQHHRQTVDQSPGIAHYCGTPQGRHPGESGPRGCTLITVDDAGHVKTNFVTTDVVRWINEVVEVTAGTDEDALLAQLEQRIEKLRAKHHSVQLMVTWQIQGRGTVLNHIRPGGISDAMTERLRDRYGKQTPGVWTVDIESHAPLDVPQEWVDEETILGDMLREFRALENDSDIPLELENFLPDALQNEPFPEFAIVKEEDRELLLSTASKLGVDLMDGEEILNP